MDDACLSGDIGGERPTGGSGGAAVDGQTPFRPGPSDCQESGRARGEMQSRAFDCYAVLLQNSHGEFKHTKSMLSIGEVPCTSGKSDIPAVGAASPLARRPEGVVNACLGRNDEVRSRRDSKPPYQAAQSLSMQAFSRRPLDHNHLTLVLPNSNGSAQHFAFTVIFNWGIRRRSE